MTNVHQGLLGFATTGDGVPAYWCWRVGELEIECWHLHHAGLAGRRPIGERPRFKGKSG